MIQGLVEVARKLEEVEDHKLVLGLEVVEDHKLVLELEVVEDHKLLLERVLEELEEISGLDRRQV